MTEQPLGPLFVDVKGCELLPEEREKLEHPYIGGVILFSRNYQCREQLKALVTSIKSVRNPGLLVAVDQEGGRVQRFREGFTLLPPASTYGEAYDRDHTVGLEASRCAGYLMACELRELGVDISFAPVLDVGIADSAVVGDRAFHNDPAIVAELARAHILGMNQGGMKATGKHFPGHGAVVEDSHTCQPIDQRTLSEIDGSDLVPYRVLCDMLHGVMTAHVSFPQVDDQLPTYSGYWLRRVLRHDIGFTGVIFSDDLSMDGAKTVGEPEDRVSAALAAGCDMALICNDPDAVDRILDSMVSKWMENLTAKVTALYGRDADQTPSQDVKRVLESLLSKVH